METLELFYPQIAARAGPYTFDKGIEIEVYSSKSSYFDWAKIRFTEQFQPKISLARKDPAAIELGYNNVFEEVFTGYVSKPYNGGGFTDEVTLKDEMLLLEETQINNTFLDTTPQEMIAYFLGKAGLSKMKLSSKGYPERKRLPIRQMNVIEAINAVHAAWNIKQPFSSLGACSIGERSRSRTRPTSSSMASTSSPSPGAAARGSSRRSRPPSSDTPTKSA